MATSACREKCQICSKNNHLADECTFLSSPCKMKNCKGIRHLLKSNTNSNPGRKFLKCPVCSDFQWLDAAILDSSSGSSSSTIQTEGCFTCGDLGHWKKQCPWEENTCPNRHCGGKRAVFISKRSHSKGRRFLQCMRCNNAFQWLNEAVAIDEKKCEIPVQIVVNTTLDQLCHKFGKELGM